MRQGETKEEAITNIKEAIRGYIAALEQDKLPVPAERFGRLAHVSRRSGDGLTRVVCALMMDS